MVTLSPDDSLFPESLRVIPQSPACLWAAGNTELLLPGSPKVAIVGSRRMTAYGKQVTTELATGLAQQGVVVVSGLAYGVDAAAHKACVVAKAPAIAVLPGGLDTIYPTAHTGLAGQILACGGLLISEYPPGTPAFPSQFIARNRLISGLSQAVIITEAAAKSGSLHTAEFAIEQGIEVMAVPGSLQNPFSEGPNRLIRSGAGVVLDYTDVLTAIGLSATPGSAQTSILAVSDPAQHTLLDLLKRGCTDATELLQRSKLSPPAFQTAIGNLEVNGNIHLQGSGYRLL